MKRFIKWLGKVVDYAKKKWDWILLFSLGIATGIVLAIVLYNIIDTVPATVLDYEPLEKQVASIQENPDLLLKTNCSIAVKDELITVTLSNEKFKVVTKYDQSFNVVSTTKSDLSTSWWLAGILSLAVGAIVGFVSLIIWALVMDGITALLKQVEPKFRKNQNK